MNFLSWLTLVFIVLKLCGVIGWSWVWVASPIWGAMVVVFPILALREYLEYRRAKEDNIW